MVNSLLSAYIMLQIYSFPHIAKSISYVLPYKLLFPSCRPCAYPTLFIYREDREARFGTTELCAFHSLHLPTQRSRGIHHVINITARHTNMLEVMNMSAGIDIHFMFTQYRVQTFLHIIAFTVVFRSLRIMG